MSPAETRAMRAVEAAMPAALDSIRAAIRQPSVSRTGEGMAAMAEQVVQTLRGMGADARLVPGQCAPIVEGALRAAPSPPTLLKGLALLEFSVSGGDWGGPARGNVHALATLVDGEGRLALDGLDTLLPRPIPAASC